MMYKIYGMKNIRIIHCNFIPAYMTNTIDIYTDSNDVYKKNTLRFKINYSKDKKLLVNLTFPLNLFTLKHNFYQKHIWFIFIRII